MLTSEGARGQEFNAWDREGGNPPAHNSILPFTRLLGGPMDFTPGIFDLSIPSMPNNQVLSTLTHQLALFITMYSPLQMAADLYENYQGHKAFQFIRDVPVDWETTRAINGSIGDYVTLARKDRNSPDWYLGSITNEQEREFTISLDFLVPQAKYEPQIYADAENAHYKHNAAAYKIKSKTVDATSTLTLKLAQGGGVAVRFKKLQN
jgi:alpha-glucosidase